MPDDAGRGATPQGAANEASDDSRSGLFPAVISGCAATSGPTPYASRRAGLAAVGMDGEARVVLTVERASASVVGAMASAARGLTLREQDVVGLVLQGASTKAIAAALHLSPHTVQDHLKAVFTKLGVTSRRDLVAQFAVA